MAQPAPSPFRLLRERPTTKTAPLVAGLAALLLSGCGGQQFATYYSDTNYRTFTHPYTDQTMAEVVTAAEKFCRQRKQVAIQTSKTCSLRQCARRPNSKAQTSASGKRQTGCRAPPDGRALNLAFQAGASPNSKSIR